MVEELKTYSSRDVDDLDMLMYELYSTIYCNICILDDVMNDENSHVYVIREAGISLLLERFALLIH